jgi:phenylpropionate dioxygenase-like ring-hydroxylating dioxygenase large terminal subunit/ferredoxin-NADP reductase
MFLKNAWYVAAWDTEVKPEVLFSRKILGDQVLLYRGEDGKAVALEDRCCHRLAPLSHGQREGNCVRCMYHGLVFDPSGRCVEVPGQDRINDKLRVRSFPVVERDHLVWIWMGDADKADPAQIHDAHWHNEESEWKAGRGGYIHYQSASQLIADNLLDFSHLAFVHQNSIGTRKQAEVKPKIERLDNGVRITYITLETPIAPFARALSTLPDVTDRYQVYSWHIKGNYFAQDSVIAPPGEGQDTTNPRALRLHAMIALTPETESTCHYFWSSAHNDFNSELPDITEKLVAHTGAAFQEDRDIIEAQQRVMNDSPGVAMVSIPADAALLQVRWMLDKLLADEATTSGLRAPRLSDIVTEAKTPAGLIAVRVDNLRLAARDVMAVRLSPLGAEVLPSFAPGAHVDLHLPNGLVRQYSLLDDGPVDGRYRLGIGLARDSRGGSAFVHRDLREGDIVHVSAPRNLFALHPAAPHVLLVAGGIGITPILSMAKRCAAERKPWRLLYCVASRERAAFLQELAELTGGEVRLHVDDEAGAPADLAAWVRGLGHEEHLYCCGPGAMMTRVRDSADAAALARLHFEWFAPPPDDRASRTEDRSFDVVLRSSGRTVHVPVGRSVLEALEEAGETVPFGCREGMCGSCVVGVHAGDIDHRDMVLSAADQAEGRQMAICVSRARSAMVELDI